MEPAGGGADGEPQQQPLPGRAIVEHRQAEGVGVCAARRRRLRQCRLGGERSRKATVSGRGRRRDRGIEPSPDFVEEDGILPRLLREHALGQPRHEHHVEDAAPHMLRTAHEDPAVAPGGRLRPAAR